MTFAELNLSEPLSKAIDACGYTTPTPIQMKAIPTILAGKDLIASAQTGTGKTAAFVLPALHHLSLSKPSFKPRVLILTPTRELATQVTAATDKYGKFMRVRVTSIVGGMPYGQQLRALSKATDIIVATPGRLMDHMQNKRLDLSHIEMLVLDEADRMLDMGFIDDVELIAKATPHKRQTLLFSATVDGQLVKLARNILKDPEKIEISAQQSSPKQIKQSLYLVDNPQHKSRLLQHLIENENLYKTIIFCGTKLDTDRLTKQLCQQGHAASAIHGDLNQRQRNRAIEELRRGKVQFLVATDVAARGIDINGITHVINYDLPKFAEDYVHRIGRTGRAGESGIAISLAMQTDARHLQRIERFTGEKLKRQTIAGLEPTKQWNVDAPNSRSKKPQNNRYKSSHARGEARDPRRTNFRDANAPRARSETRDPGARRPGQRDAHTSSRGDERNSRYTNYRDANASSRGEARDPGARRSFRDSNTSSRGETRDPGAKRRTGQRDANAPSRGEARDPGARRASFKNPNTFSRDKGRDSNARYAGFDNSSSPSKTKGTYVKVSKKPPRRTYGQDKIARDS